MVNRKYNHPDRIMNKEFESVYHNIERVNEESQKQKSVVNVKEIPSDTLMEENKLYIDDELNIKIKRNGVVKTVTLS